MSFVSSRPYEPIAGSRLRSIARSNAAGVTGSSDGGEKRKSSRRVNVKVRRSAETDGGPVATSGWSRAPTGNGRSG